MAKTAGCWCVSPAVYRQTLTAVFCCFSSMTLGLSLGWTAPAFIKIKNGETSYQLSIYGQSIVVAGLNIGLMIGTYPAGYCMDRFGRKTTLLYFSSFSLVNWILVSLASSEIYLYFARFIAGIWAGCITTTVPVYISECVETRKRGSLSTQHTVLMNVGILIAYFVGPQVAYVNFALICAAFTILFEIVFCIPPESPYFLMMKQRTDEARLALVWLRGTDDVEGELESIAVFIEGSSKKRCKYAEIFKNPCYRRPFLVSLVLCILQKYTGYFTLIAMQTVILPKNLGAMSSENCTQVVGVIILISVFIASRLMDITSRKGLLFVSHTGIAIFMGVIGVLYALNSASHIDIENYSYLLVFAFVAYVFSFSIGIGPIAVIYSGEVLPQAAKGTAGSFIASISSIASASNTFAFAAVTSHIGMHWCFFFYSFLSVLSLIFVHFYITETKGRTFQDIQEAMNSKKLKVIPSCGKCAEHRFFITEILFPGRRADDPEQHVDMVRVGMSVQSNLIQPAN